MIDQLVLNANCTTKRPLVLYKTIAKMLGIPKGRSQMDTPEKLATQVTPDKEKQSKNTTQHVLETTTRNQTRMV